MKLKKFSEEPPVKNLSSTPTALSTQYNVEILETGGSYQTVPTAIFIFSSFWNENGVSLIYISDLTNNQNWMKRFFSIFNQLSFGPQSNHSIQSKFPIWKYFDFNLLLSLNPMYLRRNEYWNSCHLWNSVCWMTGFCVTHTWQLLFFENC